MPSSNSVTGHRLSGAPPASNGTSFGAALKQWRARRGLSQLELAVRMGASQRHLSFLETGRARPSVAMVEALCDELAVPIGARNGLLTAAGHAPRHSARRLDAPELGMVARVFQHHLEALEPYPAFLFDRRYAMVGANSAAAALFGPLGAGPPADGGDPPTLLQALFDPNGPRQFIANWEDVARHTLRRMRADALIDGDADELEREIAALAALHDVPSGWDDDARTDDDPPVLILDLRLPGHALRLFTTVTTISMPFDQTAQELRMETFFPADEASDAALRELAAQQ